VGSGTAGKDKVGTVTKSQVREIARQKAADLTSASEEAAARIIEGTARSMGLEVVEG
jgi:large subunit ribosomal protein L11